MKINIKTKKIVQQSKMLKRTKFCIIKKFNNYNIKRKCEENFEEMMIT